MNHSPFPLCIDNPVSILQTFLVSNNATLTKIIGSSLPPLSAFQGFVSGDHSVVKLDHERGAFVPVDGDFGREAAVREDGLHDAPGERRTVQAAGFLGNGDEGVDKGVFLDDVVGLIIVVGLLQFIRLLSKQRSPHRHL